MLQIGIFLLALFSSLQAKETKRHEISVCALFKNEAPYLREWIEYHRLIGVSQFYLYNNGSLDSFRKVLHPYIQDGIVTLINWPDNLGPMSDSGTVWALSTQLSAYENALRWTALGKTKWLLFLEIDEFLAFPEGQTLKELLEKHEEAPGIILTSEYYDASYRSFMPPRKLVIEAVEITRAPKPSPYRSVQKTILKPELCVSFVWPPYRCLFKNGAKAAEAKKSDLRVNQYANRLNFQKIDQIKKRLPFDSKAMTDEEKNTYLQQGYEIEESDGPAHRYVPTLYQKLGW